MTVALDRALPTLTVRAVQSTAVTVPMRFALGTSAATVREAPLLLIDLLTEEGVTGRSYLFCYRPSGSAAIAAVLHEAGGLIAGDRLASVTIAAKLERCFALIGVTGVVRMALSALDMASWDALAVAAGLSVSLVTQIEQGRTGDPRLSTLRALASALGVSLDELAGKEG